VNKVLKHLNLKGFETKVFPAKLCTTPSPRKEEGVLESKKFFVCVVVDKRFEDRLSVVLLRPYTWAESEEGALKSGLRPGQRFFGWVDGGGNAVDHKDRDIHGDCDHVVAWKPV
jgi:hypothetical protein